MLEAVSLSIVVSRQSSVSVGGGGGGDCVPSSRFAFSRTRRPRGRSSGANELKGDKMAGQDLRAS